MTKKRPRTDMVARMLIERIERWNARVTAYHEKLIQRVEHLRALNEAEARLRERAVRWLRAAAKPGSVEALVEALALVVGFDVSITLGATPDGLASASFGAWLTTGLTHEEALRKLLAHAVGYTFGGKAP